MHQDSYVQRMLKWQNQVNQSCAVKIFVCRITPLAVAGVGWELQEEKGGS